MKVRTLLFLLILVILLPVSIFGVGTVLYAVERERQVFVRGAGERTNALLTAIDTELARHTSSLQSLASTNSLHSGNLDEFHGEMLRLLPSQKSWDSVSLALPSGERVLSTSVSNESLVSGRVEGCSAVGNSLQDLEPIIGDISRASGDWEIAVCLPVELMGKAHVLVAHVNPRTFLSLLTPQRLRDGWVGAVIDRNKHIVASTASNEKYLGQPAASTLQAAIGRVGEGWFSGRLIEQTPVYTAYKKSPATAWTVAIGVPAAEFDAIGRDSISLLTIGLLIAVTIALALAAGLSRQIARPMQLLALAAKALGKGERMSAPVDAMVTEVRDVSRALLASAQAVSEREDKLRAADTAKDEFLAMLGHELRNPLGALTSAAQVLNEPDTDEASGSEATEIVRRQISRMTRLVDDLLDVSRVTSAKVRLERTTVRLDNLVSNVSQTMSGLSAFDGLRFNLDLSPVWVDGDTTRLEQIVFNLLENAVKYTPAGGEITVRVARTGEDALLEVIDTGVGLTDELLPKVFDLFAQGDRSLDRSIGGLGIGLTLVKRLTEQHGGTISVHSKGVNQGAQFTIILPAVEQPAQPLRRAAKKVDVRQARKILLVEDNDDARNALLALLKHFGYSVYEASDGAEGIAVAEDVQPDVAIIDIGLPKRDGYDVAKRVRDSSYGESVFLIALTGYGGEAVRRKVLDAGFDQYLIKPISPAALAALIESRVDAEADNQGAGR